MASLRCHGDSDCNKTGILNKKISSLYNTVVVTFSHIFIHADVVNAQTFFSPKKSSRLTSKNLKIKRGQL